MPGKNRLTTASTAAIDGSDGLRDRCVTLMYPATSVDADPRWADLIGTDDHVIPEPAQRAMAATAHSRNKHVPRRAPRTDYQAWRSGRRRSASNSCNRIAWGSRVQVAYTRRWLVDLLRRIDYTQAADDALREMPKEFDRKQLEEFGDRHGISRDEVTDAMSEIP